MSFFDISRYNCSSVEDFVSKWKGKKVKCQNHNDKNPSAQVNDTNVYCYKCVDYFFYEEFVKKEPEKHVYNHNQQKAEIYHKALLDSTNQSDIRPFLKSRNIKDEIVKEFQLGFADCDPIWQSKALVFPIKNIWGNINGFGYRQIIKNTDNRPPKYWNDKDKEKEENSIFCKGANLYGIDKISDKCKHLIICEGYIDVISAYKHSFKDGICFVSIMGIALTEQHISFIKDSKSPKIKNINKISLMLDNDDTGRNATIKAIGALLKGSIYPNVIFNFKNELNYKDVDELLTKEGKKELEILLNKHCHDWCDYLIKALDNINDDLKKQDRLNEIKELIKLIQNKETKGFYASKLCAIFNRYEGLKYKQETYPNILSLNADKLKEYFLKEESYLNLKLPKYFKFNDVLEWASETLKKLESNKQDFPYIKFKSTEDVNYKILGNKNGEYAWRQYQIINPILYVKLVDIISSNWNDLKKHFEKNINIESHIKCSSMSVIEKLNDRFSNNTARQIINWWDGMEQESIKKSLEYRYVMQTDIVDCYGAIYTHSIPWALHGKTTAKENKDDYSFLGNQIDRLLQCMNHGQTSGIPQGSAIMDFIAEIILHYIDRLLYLKCKCNKITNYYILRYRDDYRIFANDISVAKKVLKCLGEILVDTGGMRLSSEKTNVSDCVVSGSIKKDKLHYFEYFKEHDSIRKNILNIYLFAKKYPNSGSILKLLQLFGEKIKSKVNEISNQILDDKKIEDIKLFDTKYIASILSEIMYSHPKTYGIACSIIFDVMSVMNNEERISVWKNISDKMQDVPNNELLNIWLERMIYINYNDIDGWYTFYQYCSRDLKRTIFFKAYSNDIIWKFPSSIYIRKLDTSRILSEEIKEKIDRAKTKEVQRIDTNAPFTIDEINPFEFDS
jgi:RNA-directed DNA polymerase